MKAEKDRIELAGLLDGEISDLRQVELLSKELDQDVALKEEFEEQRRIKSLLTTLPEYEAPDFLATRVVGDIAASRSRRKVKRWRTVAVLASSLAVCLIAVGLAVQLQHPQPRPAELASLADETSVPSLDIQPWISEVGSITPLTPAIEDEQVRDFLEFVDEVHRYRVLVLSTENVSPNLPEAIMVLDEEGTR